MTYPQSQTVSAPGALQSLWRYRWSSLLIVILVAAAAAAIGYVTAPTGKATASFGIADPRVANLLGTGFSSTDTDARYTSERATFTTSDPVLANAVTLLNNRYSEHWLRDHVSASADANADVIDLTVTAANLHTADLVANTMITAYGNTTKSQADTELRSLLASISTAQQQVLNSSKTPSQHAAAAQALANLETQIGNVRLAASQFGNGVRFVDAAQSAKAGLLGGPTGRNGFIGAALGLLVAAVISFLRADRAYDRALATAQPTDPAGGTSSVNIRTVPANPGANDTSAERGLSTPTWKRTAQPALNGESHPSTPPPPRIGTQF